MKREEISDRQTEGRKRGRERERRREGGRQERA